MDFLFENMDFLIRHWAPFPRRHPSGLPVQTIGYMAAKDHWVRHAFGTCNFSFILSGGGEYRWRGGVFEVRPPCVITQWPGERVAYGPCGGHAVWEELYLVYPARLRRVFRQMGYERADRPAWRIRQAGAVREGLERLRDLASAPPGEGVADRVDRVCEGMVLESLLGAQPAALGPAERAVAEAREGLRTALGAPVDWGALAAGRGMAVSTFRRHWRRLGQAPPARFVARLRMREARRLLAETRLAVAEVAARVGFEDALYFSRRFRMETGMAPREYRRAYGRQG